MGFLYLIECQNIYKIGFSGNVSKRIASLQTDNPFPLRLFAVFEFFDARLAEKHVHKYFFKFRYRGEWFLFKQENIEEFLRLCYEMGGKEIPLRDIEETIENCLYDLAEDDYET